MKCGTGTFAPEATTEEGASRKPVGCSKWKSFQLCDCHSGSFQVVSSLRCAVKLQEVCMILPGRGTGAASTISAGAQA